MPQSWSMLVGVQALGKTNNQSGTANENGE